jgi:hypothetical protein
MGEAIANAVTKGMQTIKLAIRKYRIRILYLRNKKPKTIHKTNGLAMDLVHLDTGLNP